jgi:sensor histidine kinase regulating citrate/malate metabolism
MNSVYVHAHGRTNQSQSRVLAIKPTFFVGKVSLMFMLTMLIGLLSVVFLINANQKATFGYEITRLEEQRDAILTSRDQKNIEISNSQSFSYIMESEKIQRMVPVSEVHYADREGVVAYR